MNSNIIKDLVKLANSFDKLKLIDEADEITKIATKLSNKLVLSNLNEIDLQEAGFDKSDFYKYFTENQFITLLNSPIYQRFKLMMEKNPDFNDQSGEMFKALTDQVQKFLKDTTLEGQEDYFVEKLIDQKFKSNTNNIDVIEEIFSDMLDETEIEYPSSSTFDY